jgi:hypothetical protein
MAVNYVGVDADILSPSAPRQHFRTPPNCQGNAAVHRTFNSASEQTAVPPVFYVIVKMLRSLNLPAVWFIQIFAF